MRGTRQNNAKQFTIVEPLTSFTGESVRAFLIICCPDSGEAASSEALRLKPDTIVTCQKLFHKIQYEIIRVHLLFGESTAMMSLIFKLDPAPTMTWGIGRNN